MKTTPIAVALTAAAALAACRGSTQAISTAPAATTTPAPVTEAARPVTNADGYTPKKIGDKASLRVEGGSDYVTFTILKITRDIPCSSGFAEKPDNGHYLGIYMDVTTTADLTKQEVPYFTTNQFSVVGPDGIEENSTAGKAYSCLPEAETLPVQITNATHRKGWVVLDVKSTTGKVRLTQDTMTGGWEYPL